MMMEWHSVSKNRRSNWERFLNFNSLKDTIDNFQLCGIICLGIGLWLVLDKYAIDNLAFATAKVQGYDQDAGLRDLVSS